MTAPAEMPKGGPEPLDERELTEILAYEVQNSLGEEHTQVADRQRQADERYRGAEFGNEIEGRSRVVMRVSQETIEWIKPAAMSRFFDNENLAHYGDESEEGSAAGIGTRMTRSINYYFREKLGGFNLFLEWISAALLYPHAPVKLWVERVREPQFERFAGLSEDELEALLQMPDVEPIELTQDAQELQDPQTGLPVQVPVFDVRIKRWRSFPRMCAAGMPPEEFLISADARSIASATFVGHRRLMTKGALAALGISWDVLEQLPTDTDVSWDFRKETREADTRSSFGASGRQRADKASQTVCVVEGHLRADRDGDGYAEKLHVLAAGRTNNFRLLRADYADDVLAFVDLCSIPMPYQFCGYGFVDLLADLDLLISTLYRLRLDNIYQHNDPRHAMREGGVDLDSYMNREPGAPVFTEGAPSEEIVPLPVAPLPPWAQEMVADLEDVRENRSGVPRYNQSRFTDAQNTTATASAQVTAAANAKVDLLVRIFAEGGIKDFFVAIPKLLRAAAAKPERFRIGDEWVTFDPNEWPEAAPVSVQVGVSAVQTEQQLVRLNSILERQTQALAEWGPGYMAAPEQLYHTVSDMLSLMGKRNVGRYFLDPRGKELPERGPSPEQIKVEADAEQGAAQVKISAGKLEIDAGETQRRLDLTERKDQMEDARERERIAMEERVRVYAADQQYKAAMAQVEAQKEVAAAKAAQPAPAASGA